MTKVFDLSCALGHRFEGWFSATDDFERQRQTGVIRCPVCDRSDIFRVPSSPRLNLLPSRVGKSKESSATDGRFSSDLRRERLTGICDDPILQTAELAYLALVLDVIAGAEDVGGDFADEARRIHRGEAEARAILGLATQDERRALGDEGIEVLSLSIASSAKAPVH